MWKRVCLASLYVATALANTEKAIFLGPKTVNIPPTHPNLQDLRIDTLTPAKWSIRTHIDAQFPTDGAKFGRATWLALDDLTEGQRYELRVCWAATVRHIYSSTLLQCIPCEKCASIFEMPTIVLKRTAATHKLSYQHIRAQHCL
jgi:hypothetical protein